MIHFTIVDLVSGTTMRGQLSVNIGSRLSKSSIILNSYMHKGHRQGQNKQDYKRMNVLLDIGFQFLHNILLSLTISEACEVLAWP